MSNDYICHNCGEVGELIKEEIHHSGTHCNYGREGVHDTGHYVSKCCEATYSEVMGYERLSMEID